MESENKGWWGRRTSMEKALTIVATLGVLAAIGLLVGLIVVLVKDDKSDLDGICFSQSCIHESSKVLAQMNLTADPCDDFYEYACGTFLKETVIPDDKTLFTSFSAIENQLKEQLRIIVTEPIVDSEIQPFKDVKLLYQACMNTALLDTRGFSHVLTAIGGWPAVAGDSWVGTGWTWQQSVVDSKTSGYSLSYFHSFSVSTDNKNTTRRIIRIDQASLGLNREYLIKKFEEPFVIAYRDYQVDLAVLFGADRTRAETEMAEVLEFEFALAEISMDREDRRDAEALYNIMTIEALQTRYSYNTWLPFFISILPDEVELLASEQVIVGALTFFDELGNLLARTTPRTLANYVAWRRAVSSVGYLPQNFRERQQLYIQATTGRAVEDPRWLQCVDTSLSYFPHAFGALYVRKHFKEDAKQMALDMVTNIKEEFKIILDGISWMDAETRTAANEKAETISEQIGFADELMNDTAIALYYSSFPTTINEAEYYESIFSLNQASTNRNNKRLHEAVDKDEWTAFVTPAIVNAFYSFFENSIKFPAGILQGAFFNAERPQYMNYGGIGFVIGHEITHGFDDQGSQYDANGNLLNWWANATKNAYLERAQCIINQYGNYTEPLTDLKLNGINTQGENIADNGGIKQSYHAYVRWSADNEEKTMPGIDLSQRQMFWVAAAQVWCSVYREEAMKNRVTTGVHSPGQFRVIGPMSNAKEFSEDFNCASGTNMNPVSKCEVW